LPGDWVDLSRERSSTRHYTNVFAIAGARSAN
jgi:hypothetical protein